MHKRRGPTWTFSGVLRDGCFRPAEGLNETRRNINPNSRIGCNAPLKVVSMLCGSINAIRPLAQGRRNANAQIRYQHLLCPQVRCSTCEICTSHFPSCVRTSSSHLGSPFGNFSTTAQERSHCPRQSRKLLVSKEAYEAHQAYKAQGLWHRVWKYRDFSPFEKESQTIIGSVSPTTGQ